MSWTVTYWNHAVQEVRQYATSDLAHQVAARLRQASDLQATSSLVPIRAMPTAVFDRMQVLHTVDYEGARCSHRCLWRLCIPCVQALIDREAQTHDLHTAGHPQ